MEDQQEPILIQVCYVNHKNDSHKKDKSVDEAENWWVEHIEKWRQKMNIDRFILCGHSLGGYISFCYSLKYPQRVIQLVMVSPVGVLTSLCLSINITGTYPKRSICEKEMV